VNTEITDNEKAAVFYDAECAICTASARRMERLLHARNIELQPLQAPWVGERLGRTPEQLRAEMHLLLPDGRIFAGADAFVQLSRYYWWGWPFHLFARLPGAMPLLRLIYRWVARNRKCLNGACAINPPGGITSPLPRGGCARQSAGDFLPLDCKNDSQKSATPKKRHGAFFEMP
jgi:predicted DCC family thiol-disulfide oxidoreductase YuxK